MLISNYKSVDLNNVISSFYFLMKPEFSYAVGIELKKCVRKKPA